jgi:Helix-turn-helix domain
MQTAGNGLVAGARSAPTSAKALLSSKNVTNLPRLALSLAEAAAVLGVSDDFFSEHIAGELRCVRRGRKKLYAVRELEAWLSREASLLLEDT